MTDPNVLQLPPSNFAWWDDRVFQKEPIDIQRLVNAECPNWVGGASEANRVTEVNLLTVPQSRFFVCQKVGVMTQQLAVPSDVLWMVQGLNTGLAPAPTPTGYLTSELMVTQVAQATYKLSPLSWLCGVPWVDFYKILPENVTIKIRLTNFFMRHDQYDISGDVICDIRLTGWMVNALGSSWPRAGLGG